MEEGGVGWGSGGVLALVSVRERACVPDALGRYKPLVLPPDEEKMSLFVAISEKSMQLWLGASQLRSCL